MSLAAAVIAEPLRWPIAPDGYIPNSVIRSWRCRGRVLSRKQQQPRRQQRHTRSATNAHEDLSSRIIWLVYDEEDEDEDEDEDEASIDDVYRRRREKEEEKHKKRHDEAAAKETGETKREREVGRNEKENERRMEVGERERRKKMGEGRMDRVDVLKQPHHIQTNTNVQSRESNTETKRQRPSGLTPREWSKPPGETPVASVDALIPKIWSYDSITAEPELTTHPQPVEPQTWATHPQKAAPSPPEDSQPRPHLVPTLQPHPVPTPQPHPVPTPQPHLVPHLVPTPRPSLLFQAKYSNIRDQVQVPLDRKVLELYGKFRGGKRNLSQHRKLFSTRPARSTIQTQLHRSHHKRTSLQGFCSPQPATPATPATPDRLAAHLVLPIASRQCGQVAAHHRVVQGIQTRAGGEPAPSSFHHVIPVASRHNFLTADTCGKTQYGRLQFHWVRQDKL